METTTGLPITVADIAKICHEANRAYCVGIGDHSQKSWEEAEQYQRESAVKGVQFRLNNPTAPQSAQHDAWAKDKLADGWVYGEVKDPITKTHPCLVTYDQLPEEQRRKDALFQAVVDTFMPARNVITITADEYAKLKKDAAWLGCLEQAGVDNWDGCSYAADQFAKEFPEYQD
jgi:hypothetical protein